VNTPEINFTLPFSYQVYEINIFRVKLLLLILIVKKNGLVLKDLSRALLQRLDYKLNRIFIIAAILIGCLVWSCTKQPSEAGEGIVIEKILIEGGTFTMGNTRGDGSFNQLPPHTVTVGAYYLSKYEITIAQYRSVMEYNPTTTNDGNRPVERVSWFDAVTFCNRLSIMEGLEPCYEISGRDVTCNFSAGGYRLPTEAEWEFAARGGSLSTGYKYSGGNDLNRVGWYYSNSKGLTHQVGTKMANELGLHDMSGNVWEWCWDWYGSYTAESQSDPAGPDAGIDRVFRGGNMITHVDYTQVFFRGFHNPSLVGPGVGFRIARTK